VMASKAEKAIYSVDPLAKLLLDRLRIRPHVMALAAVAWGVVFLLVIPAACGCLRGEEGYLGSLDDWHAQLLSLLVFPAACAFYVWQPRAIATGSLRLEEATAAGCGYGYRSRSGWRSSSLTPPRWSPTTELGG
jgi:hypothetical protein